MIEVKEKAEETPSQADALGSVCCVIRKNWGQPGVPSNKLDYLDHIAFTGGVARNVPTVLARKWAALPGIGVFLLKNTADEGDFIKVTGVKPMPAEQLAAMLQGYDIDLIAEALGDEAALKISQALRRQISKAEKK